MRTVCAYSLWFPKRSAADEVWRDITSTIWNWYQVNQPDVVLPVDWERGLEKRFVPSAGHALDCSITQVDDTPGPLRELRWVYPDARDDSLLWTIDALTLPSDGAVLSLLLRIASADFELLPARFTLRTPRVIRNIVARGDAHVGVHPVHIEPKFVAPEHIPELTSLLLEQSRRHPIVVISPEPYTDDIYAVDTTAIATTLAGLASVYVLSSRWAGFALTDEVGKQLSCYNGAVRVYWPRFDLGADPFAHPLWLPPQIHDFGSSEGFARFLMRMGAGVASFRYVEPESVRTFRARAEATRVAKMREERKSGYEGLFDEYVRLDAHARELREGLDAANEEVAALRAQIASKWIPPMDERAAERATEIDDRPEPKNVLEAVQDAQRRTSHVIYLPEALESARESPYKQPDKVFSALLAIDDVAGRWAEQMAGGPNIGARRDAFRKCGFDYKEDISQTAEGKWGTEYTYPYEGKRIVFAPHITIGAKSADRCISIHMHWDEAKRKVVVAHVGRHKTNTRS